MQPQKGIKIVKDYCLKLLGIILKGQVGGYMKVGTYSQMGVAIICLLLGGLLWFVVPSYLFIIKKCTIVGDSRLAPGIAQSIVNFIEESSVNKSFQALSLVKVKRQFPIIEHLESTYAPSGSLHCSFKAVRPLMLINDQYLFMNDNSIQNSDTFAPFALCDLPIITMCQEGTVELSYECKNCLKKLSYHLFDQFFIRWIDHTCIYLKDKQLPNIIVRADAQSILDDTLLTKYERVKSDIARQRSYAKKSWLIDVRFKNQIVVAQKGVEGL